VLGESSTLSGSVPESVIDPAIWSYGIATDVDHQKARMEAMMRKIMPYATIRIKQLISCAVITANSSLPQNPQLMQTHEGKASVWELLNLKADYFAPFAGKQQGTSSHLCQCDRLFQARCQPIRLPAR
jgi:hypothetical protein